MTRKADDGTTTRILRAIGLAAAALLADACTAAAAERADVPVHQTVLPDGAPRYSVPVTVGDGPPIEAALDTGSFGLRVLASALSPDQYEATELHRRYPFGGGARFDGVLARATLGVGPDPHRRPRAVPAHRQRRLRRGEARLSRVPAGAGGLPHRRRRLRRPGLLRHPRPVAAPRAGRRRERAEPSLGGGGPQLDPPAAAARQRRAGPPDHRPRRPGSGRVHAGEARRPARHLRRRAARLGRHGAAGLPRRPRPALLRPHAARHGRSRPVGGEPRTPAARSPGARAAAPRWRSAGRAVPCRSPSRRGKGRPRRSRCIRRAGRGP